MSGRSSFQRWSEEARLRDLPDLPDDETPRVDRALVAKIREYVARHFVREADWRWGVAERFPQEAWRNNRAALGLSNAADEVRKLPADDERLARLAELVALAGGRLSRAISFRDETGYVYSASLRFWCEESGDLDALLERIVRESERAAAETFRAAS